MLPFCPRQLLVPAGNDARAVRISLPLPVDLWRRRTVVCCTLPMPSADAICYLPMLINVLRSADALQDCADLREDLAAAEVQVRPPAPKA